MEYRTQLKLLGVVLFLVGAWGVHLDLGFKQHAQEVEVFWVKNYIGRKTRSTTVRFRDPRTQHQVKSSMIYTEEEEFRPHTLGTPALVYQGDDYVLSWFLQGVWGHDVRLKGSLMSQWRNTSYLAPWFFLWLIGYVFYTHMLSVREGT